MLTDRPYMRNFGGDSYPVLKGVLCALLGVFLIQSVLGLTKHPYLLSEYMALSPRGMASGFVWTVFSYGLLHVDLLHILFNGLGLFFLGRALEPMLGSKRFGLLLLAGVLLGGLVWLAVNFQRPGQVLGASAAVTALLIFYCCMRPNDTIHLLLFFVVAVPVKPKYLAWGTLAFELFGFVFTELPGRSSVAYSAHLGGMLAGYLAYKAVTNPVPFLERGGRDIVAPRWLSKRKAQNGKDTQRPFKLNLTNRQDLKAEVDRILDKINTEGFGALSAEEKRILDRAKDLLSR